MIAVEKVNIFIQSQKSIQSYQKAKDAFFDVLINMSEEEYKTATDNLIIMALHEWVLWQLMHFPDNTKWFRVMQLTIPNWVPIEVLKFVIAHEIWHIMQWRNWKEWDWDSFERWPDDFAKKIGFPRTEKIAKYINLYWNDSE